MTTSTARSSRGRCSFLFLGCGRVLTIRNIPIGGNMQFEIGETVKVKLDDLAVIGVEVDDVGAPWVTLSTRAAGVLHLPIDAEFITYTREVPADGVPGPGELWADQVGCLYVVQLSPTAGRTAKLIDVDRPHETAAGWEDVHRGTTGPIFRVAERPQVGGA